MEVDVGEELLGDEVEGLNGSVGGETLGWCRRCEHEGSEGEGGEESLGAHGGCGKSTGFGFGWVPPPPYLFVNSETLNAIFCSVQQYTYR